MQLGKSKNNKEVKNKRQVEKCTMTDILFITLINYIREYGRGGFITISKDDLDNDTKKSLKIIDTKSQLLAESGFISKDINHSIYKKQDKNNLIKKFMAQNEYNYTNNLFHKTLKFIKDNDYGMYSGTFKLYNSITRKAVILSDFYEMAMVGAIKKALFEYLNLYPSEWTKYIQSINNKNTKMDVLDYTKELFKTYFEDMNDKGNEYKLNFYNNHGLEWDIIYPAYIISIFDYKKNNEDIDDYIANKIKKLNFDKTDYIEQRSKKGTYKNTYNRLKVYNPDELKNEVDKELFELIQNDNYFDTIQIQLYKWYKFSIFDTHKKTNYINSKEQKKIINKAMKQNRNEQIQMFKELGWTQKQVAEDLHISLRTVKNYWNE